MDRATEIDGYKHFFEAFPHPALVVDGEGKTVQANAAARALKIEPARPGRATNAVERVVDDSGKSRHLSVQKIPLHPHHEAHVFIDVTRMADLEKRFEELRHADSLGCATATLLADLERVFQPMVLLGEALAGQLGEGSWQGKVAKELAVTASVAARHLTAALGEARGLPRPDGEEPIEPSFVLHQLLPLFERLVGAEGDLELDLDPEAGAVKVDQTAFERAVLNLIGSAKEAMERGALLSIVTRSVTLGHEEASLRGCPAPGDYVAVSVSDTGSKARLRTPFFEGFTTVHKFVRSAGGGLFTHAERTGGASVTMYLRKFKAA